MRLVLHDQLIFSIAFPCAIQPKKMCFGKGRLSRPLLNSRTWSAIPDRSLLLSTCSLSGQRHRNGCCSRNRGIAAVVGRSEPSANGSDHAFLTDGSVHCGRATNQTETAKPRSRTRRGSMPCAGSWQSRTEVVAVFFPPPASRFHESRPTSQFAHRADKPTRAPSCRSIAR